MELWIGTRSRSYGLAPVAGYSFEGARQIVYSLPDDLEIRADSESLDDEGRGTVLFCPDGSIDEGSLKHFFLVRVKDGETVALVQKDPINGYVIVDEPDVDIQERLDVLARTSHGK